MAMNAVLAGTPYFVLMEGNRRCGPEVLQHDARLGCTAIYGFSQKRFYDRFCMNAPSALTPYPLVKSYLRSQIEASDDGVKLVIVDAVGPQDPCLDAATMAAVLAAHESQSTDVVVAYQLSLDDSGKAYRLNLI